MCRAFDARQAPLQLAGSVIASRDQAVADGLNRLACGTLVTEDIGDKRIADAPGVAKLH